MPILRGRNGSNLIEIVICDAQKNDRRHHGHSSGKYILTSLDFIIYIIGICSLHNFESINSVIRRTIMNAQNIFILQMHSDYKEFINYFNGYVMLDFQWMYQPTMSKIMILSTLSLR